MAARIAGAILQTKRNSWLIKYPHKVKAKNTRKTPEIMSSWDPGNPDYFSALLQHLCLLQIFFTFVVESDAYLQRKLAKNKIK